MEMPDVTILRRESRGKCLRHELAYSPFNDPSEPVKSHRVADNGSVATCALIELTKFLRSVLRSVVIRVIHKIRDKILRFRHNLCRNSVLYTFGEFN